MVGGVQLLEALWFGAEGARIRVRRTSGSGGLWVSAPFTEGLLGLSSHHSTVGLQSPWLAKPFSSKGSYMAP